VKLTTKDIEQLRKVISTCLVGSIDSIIIEDGTVRGINDDKNFTIISMIEGGGLKLPQKMGLTRLSQLQQRLDLFSASDLVVDVRESDRGEISSLDIRAGKSNIQFRCMSTSLIPAPRSLNDSEAFKIFITKAELKILLSALRMLGSKKDVQLIIKPDSTVTFILGEAAEDVLTMVLENPIDGTCDDHVVHYYTSEILLSVLKTASEEIITLNVGKRGIIWYKINDLSVAVLPKINNTDEDEE
jgi:hypothetical protein